MYEVHTCNFRLEFKRPVPHSNVIVERKKHKKKVKLKTVNITKCNLQRTFGKTYKNGWTATRLYAHVIDNK